jgi:SAM-dependent methyltransferase
LALERRGYDVEGVEWSKEAVGLTKKRFPELKVRTGDVRNLKVKDGYYSGYISLGVVEHFKSGPEDYLREANRILKRGGVAFISVPYLNLLRRIKNLFGFYRGSPVGLDFYQYAFTEAEIEDLIQKSGFKIVSSFHYDAYKSLRDEIPILKKVLFKKQVDNKFVAEKALKKESIKEVKIQKFVGRPLYLRIIDILFGHMTMVVCVKR